MANWVSPRRRLRFWWSRTCTRYGHSTHRRRFGPLSCWRWQAGHWLGCHTSLGRAMASRRLRRMEANWARQRARAGRTHPWDGSPGEATTQPGQGVK